MRSVLTRISLLLLSIFSLINDGLTQGGFTGLNGTVINLPCNQTCVTQAFQIPHLKTTSDYSVNTIPYRPLDYVTTAGTEDPNLYNDDRFSQMFDLPFPFCFYDSTFTKV